MPPPPSPLSLRIREFDLEMLYPCTEKMYDPDHGGSKVVMLGRPGSGKTFAITSILYHKRHIFPYAVVVSGTEDNNSYWGKHFPPSFVYNQLTPDIIERFIDRQTKVRHKLVNPWSVLLLDDCADESKIINGHLMNKLFKCGRHYKILFLLAIQFAADIRPVIRANVDYTFVFRETRYADRKRIFENYAACFPNFNTFCQVLDAVTEDHTALVIRNNGTSNNLEDNVFWFKARPFPPDFKFGSPLYWYHHAIRYMPNIDQSDEMND